MPLTFTSLGSPSLAPQPWGHPNMMQGLGRSQGLRRDSERPEHPSSLGGSNAIGNPEPRQTPEERHFQTPQHHRLQHTDWVAAWEEPAAMERKAKSTGK